MPVEFGIEFPDFLDEKVKVTANDTTPSYLKTKLESTDGSVTFTEKNDGGNETLDLKVAGLVAPAMFGTFDIVGDDSKKEFIWTHSKGTGNVFLAGVRETGSTPNKGIASIPWKRDSADPTNKIIFYFRKPPETGELFKVLFIFVS